MNEYFVSLVMGLQGCYVRFLAPSELAVRKYCKRYMGSMWCSVYNTTAVLCGPVNIINDTPICIDEDGTYD